MRSSSTRSRSPPGPGSRSAARRPSSGPRLAQLDGRLPLTALTSKLGARTTLVLVYTLTAAVTLLLFAGGTLAPILVLSLLAGAAIAAVYALQDVYAYQLIDPRHLGTLLGIQQAVFAAGGALGSAAAGALLGATGSYIPAVTIISAGSARPPACSCSAGHPAEASDPTAGQDPGDPDASLQCLA